LFLYAANTECKVRRMRDLFGLGDRSSQCKIESTLPARLPEVAAVVRLRSTIGCAEKGGTRALIETPMAIRDPSLEVGHMLWQTSQARRQALHLPSTGYLLV
jgi:hypothetical protein